eukprot:CAMPEP_0198318968 /NCGR_PEP_ID=MMETSP1450-20131203/8207_1 /TAXON_ID=753684 ORGANISM="Madagascaria erythrocladiodes, Strain CCMP3234" /NCGR_SAMPLE_ID=MMETSP1450 /ASSEMBLY_ACC=CAM_ASM_001115 /LENGTH=154 /DNA_ID=CAMNT_0044022321 /DNA_START=68 /DNA_END=532 /DNA_ORIENTATION=-
MRPGAKYFEWERKGVPLRMELGPRDADKRSVFCAQRTGGPKFSIPIDDAFEEEVESRLDGIQRDLFMRAKERLEAKTYRMDSYSEMREKILAGDDLGFFLVPWKCNTENEEAIKEDCKATIRCYPAEGQEEASGKACFYSGEPADRMAIFARAY